MRDKIAFCICTNNRKSKLKKNLFSLIRLKNLKNYNIEIILVSNDKSNYMKILNQFSKYLKIKFFKESKSGVTHSRNKILEILRTKKFKYAAFFDDDCIISKNWLVSMLKMIKNKKVDIVTGPQISQSKNIFLKIMERNQAHATKTKWASTNNVFFKLSAIKNKIKFSNKLNRIGGEDQLFFLELNKLGKKIFWNSHAPVFELIDRKRENYRWFIKRNLRYGASSAIIYKDLHGLFIGYSYFGIKILKDLLKSAEFLIKSISISNKNFMKFVMYFMRFLGGIIGLIGIQIKEY
tara:strand:- start:9785 stop:10663 length:879 start_codon:yes stop_codon:yes gene_type:complete